MIRTVLFLIVTLSAVVYFAFTSNVFDVSFNAAQTDALITMLKLYLASCLYCFVVSEVAENYSGKKKIHLIQLGWFANDYISNIMKDDAKLICPDVECHFVDGRKY